MSKKTFIILIIIAIILGLSVLLFFVYKNAQKNNNGEPVTLRDFFPFGQSTPGQTPGGITPGGEPTDPQTPGEPTRPTARLRKVSDTPVTGYTLLQKNVPVDPNSIPAPEQKTITSQHVFSKTLKQGDSGVDITELQKLLNQCPATQIAQTGAGSPGREGTTYGPATSRAVTVFQELFAAEILTPQNLSRGNGLVDELTLKKIQSGFVCTLPIETPETVLASVVRYATRGNSHIFDAFADTLQSRRLSNTTIPRVHESFFADQGKKILLRSLQADNQTIETIIGNITEPVVGGDSVPEITLLSMPKNITDISISPDGKEVLYLIPSGGNLVGFTNNLDGRNQKQVFSSPFSGWLAQWSTQNKLVFTIKATGYATGYAYTTDRSKGDFVKIAGPITGLTTLPSPDGNFLLINRNTQAGPSLAIQEIATKKIRNLNLYGLPEKCVWTKNSLSIYCAIPVVIPSGNVYPDSWYQGTVLFTDSFWLIDPTGNYSNQRLFSPLQEGGEATDGIRLNIDDSSKYLYFINKDTNILWQYDLSPQTQQVI